MLHVTCDWKLFRFSNCFNAVHHFSKYFNFIRTSFVLRIVKCNVRCLTYESERRLSLSNCLVALATGNPLHFLQQICECVINIFAHIFHWNLLLLAPLGIHKPFSNWLRKKNPNSTFVGCKQTELRSIATEFLIRIMTQTLANTLKFETTWKSVTFCKHQKKFFLLENVEFYPPDCSVSIAI